MIFLNGQKKIIKYKSNMNKFVLLPFFLLLFINAKAQDKIITLNRDTIHCTIRGIGNERITYELKNKDGSVTGRFISLSEVVEYTRSPRSKINSNEHKLKTSRLEHIPESRWNFGLNAGRSTMPWYFDNLQSSSTLPNFYKELKTGYHLNADAHYLITDFLGVGAEYSFFIKSTSGNIQREYYTSTFLMMSEEYNQYINYLGLSVFFQQHPDPKQKFILRESISAGVLLIQLENQITYPNIDYSGYTDIVTNSLFTGKSFSAKLGLTAEYKLLKFLSVGLGGDFIWCSLKKASFEAKGSNNYSTSSDDQELTKPMNLSRIDYSFVLRFHF